MLNLTTLGIVLGQLGTYPQHSHFRKVIPFGVQRKTLLATGLARR